MNKSRQLVPVGHWASLVQGSEQKSPPPSGNSATQVSWAVAHWPLAWQLAHSSVVGPPASVTGPASGTGAGVVLPQMPAKPVMEWQQSLPLPFTEMVPSGVQAMQVPVALLAAPEQQSVPSTLTSGCPVGVQAMQLPVPSL
jgi:hypothetical protein